MPGILGFTGRHHDNASNHETIQRMARALEPESHFHHQLETIDETALGRVTLGVVNPHPQPHWNGQHTTCIVMEGELYNAGSLQRHLPADHPLRQKDGHDDAALILALYEQCGCDFVPELNGNFSFALWHAPTRRLTLVNDRLGLHPVYYTQTANGFLFASGLRALLAEPSVSRQVDHVAIAQFFTFDHLLHERTLLRDVHLLPAASILTYEDGRLNIDNYWRPQHPETYTLRSEEAWMTDMMDHLRRAVHRQSPGDLRAGMLLSGGLDSRVLLMLLKETTDLSHFPTFTWGIPGCDDARYSREVARKMGTDHHFFELKPDWLLEHAEACVRSTDGMGNIVNLHARATLDQQAPHANVLYKGFLGDAMMGFAQRQQHWADYEPDTAIEAHLTVHRSQGVVTFGPEDHAALFTPHMQQQIGSAVMDGYRQGMADARSPQLADQRIFYDYRQRVPRHTLNGVQVVRSRAVVRLPFVDNDLIDLLLQVPPGLRYHRRIMRNAFVRDFSELARIPLPDTGLPMLDCARDIQIRTQRWLRWHLGKLGLGSKDYIRRRPYKDYATWFRTVLRDWVQSTLLDDRALQRGYFQPQFVRNIVQEHMSGKDHSIRLGAFMSLELWHRQYIDRNEP